MVDATATPGALTALMLFADPLSAAHTLAIGYTDATPLNTNIALGAGPPDAPPFVGLGVDVNVSTRAVRSTYTAVAGTLRLTRRCPTGLAGSLTDLVMVERASQTTATLHPQACTLTLPTITFAIGSTCEGTGATTDAGVSDAASDSASGG